MRLRTFLIGTLTALAVISCGGGGGGNFAGGIGGTGVSYGPVTGFGSVIVNGVEFKTGSASFTKDGVSTTQAGLGVGMVVSVTNDGNGNAKSVSFNDNAQGPVSNITATRFEVLGITVTVNNLTVYSDLTDLNSDGVIDIKDLANDDIVEVSGQLTGANAVTATRVEKQSATCLSTGLQIETKGKVSNVDTVADTFNLGTLTVNANGHMPSTFSSTSSDYVEVKSASCPSHTGGVLVASAIDKNITEGPDLSDLDHHDQGELEVKGVADNYQVTTPGCTFSVNGQTVSDSSHADCAKLANGTSVEVRGALDSTGALVATSVKVENTSESEANIDIELTAKVASVTKTGLSPVDGSLTLTAQSTAFNTSINTSFESETTHIFNLDSIAVGTCVEVKAIDNHDGTATTLQVEQRPSTSCP